MVGVSLLAPFSRSLVFEADHLLSIGRYLSLLKPSQPLLPSFTKPGTLKTRSANSDRLLEVKLIAHCRGYKALSETGSLLIVRNTGVSLLCL